MLGSVNAALTLPILVVPKKSANAGAVEVAHGLTHSFVSQRARKGECAGQ